MSFTLEIHFEYLCAFAPPSPFTGSPPPKETWVVLQDHSTHEDPGLRHFARLLYDKDDRAPDSEVTDADKTPYSPVEPCSPVRQVIELHGEMVEILPEGVSIIHPDLAAQPGLQYLLPIEKARLGLETFDSDRLGGAPADLAARLHLRTGTLDIDTSQVTQPFELKNSVTEDVFPVGGIARRIINRIEIQDYVDLDFHRFRAPSEPVRTLRIRNQDATRPAVISIRNCEKTWICTPSISDYTEQDSEINLFFPLSAAYDPPPEPARMILHLEQDSSNGVCAPKTFSNRS